MFTRSMTNRRIAAIILTVLLIFTSVFVSADRAEAATKDKWVIYWYLCGSDLESNYGAATYDLMEMLQVQLPDNVKVVIQTGGAKVWNNDAMDPSKIQRWVYDDEDLKLVQELKSANMGKSNTLKNFLSFAKKNYPAEHTMVLFWNHGGGSVTGAAFDEKYNFDSLTLKEMKSAFSSVYKANSKNPPIDIIGFDTCLMATIDTANTFKNLGRYLVASEELEPGNGWNYTGMLQTLAENPKISAKNFAKAICDTYMEGCQISGTADTATLSVTDLTKVSKLVTAYNNYGKEALTKAVKDPTVYNDFSKIANGSENYGGNTKEQGYTNMVDLGHLASQTKSLLPKNSKKLLTALNNAVIYKVNGRYREDSHGLSCYYSFNGDKNDLKAYTKIGTSKAINYFYSYGVNGKLDTAGMKYVKSLNKKTEKLKKVENLKSVKWANKELTLSDDGCAVLTLGKKASDILSSIAFELYYADPESDIMLCLGRDNDIDADWKNGVFKDNFRGVWGALDGNLCYMEIAYEGDDFNEYTVPILLNGEEYNMLVTYDFNTEQFYINGVRKPLAESGAADKNLLPLYTGDVVQPIHYAAAISADNSDLVAIPVGSVVVTEKTTFTEEDLGDGLFVMMYVMRDAQGNEVYSNPATFTVAGDEITTSVDF